jgi:hypothetical protein
VRFRPVRLLGLVTLTLALGAAVPTSGCGTGPNCGGVDCARSDVAVYWPAGTLPDDAIVLLCVDGVCGVPAHATPGPVWWRDDRGPGWVVRTNEGAGRARVALRLEQLDGEGTVVRAIEGTGKLRGTCCTSVAVRIDDSGKGFTQLR